MGVFVSKILETGFERIQRMQYASNVTVTGVEGIWAKPHVICQRLDDWTPNEYCTKNAHPWTGYRDDETRAVILREDIGDLVRAVGLWIKP